RNGHDVRAIYPRHGDAAGEGTLMIPNTVGAVAGRPQREAVDALIAYLLSPEVERFLYETTSHNVPLHATDVDVSPEHRIPDPLRIDYEAISEAMPEAIAAANEILLGR